MFCWGNPANKRICRHIVKLENLRDEFPPLLEKYNLNKAHPDIYMHKPVRFEILNLSTRKLPAIYHHKNQKWFHLHFSKMISR